MILIVYIVYIVYIYTLCDFNVSIMFYNVYVVYSDFILFYFVCGILSLYIYMRHMQN